ncbi:MAG: CidA/LrgA family protein [Eubacteriales bacterium]|nr:CidA/LrgA family protein [Eubacteriales bacterium]
MKYMKQFGIILTVTCAGEIVKSLIPLPVPGSIYGLVLMLGLLASGKLRVESVKETGEFLIEIMPMMFIPAAVGLMASWEQLRPVLFPVCVITAVSTFLVMIVTGKVTDFFLSKKEKSSEGGKKNE